MVRVGSLFVNGSSESLEPVVQFAGERDRDVRCSERRHHLEARLLQISDAVEAEDREPSKRPGTEIIDIGVALGVHPREPPAAPIGETTTEQLGLDSGVVVVQILAAHHDAYVGRQWRPTDARYSLADSDDGRTAL